MSKFLGGKEITTIYLGKKVIGAVYRGTLLIYTAIRSCFGSGMWVGEKPWIGKDAWKNN